MSKIAIIDEKGKLFGLINLLDLIVLFSLLVLLYLGSSAYLALKTSVPQIVDFSPKQINNEKASKVILILKNDRRIGSAKVTMIPYGFAGERIHPSTSFDKRKRNEVTVSIPAGVSPGNYLVELELAVLDVLNRQLSHVVHFSEPIVIKGEEVALYYPWPIEVDVLLPGDSAIIRKQLKVGDTMVDSRGMLIAEVLSIRPSRSSDTLNLTGKAWRKREVLYEGAITARMRLQPEILDNQLAFQGKTISAGERLKFNTDSLSLDGYIIGKGDVKYQKTDKGWEVLAEVVMLGITKENATMLKPKFTQIDESGNIWAEVLELTQEESQIKGSYKNIVVRMFLNCDSHQKRIYCQNVLIEPGALLNFKLGQQQVIGIIRQVTNPDWIKVIVELHNVTPEVEAYLRRGVKEEVTGREVTMEIEKIVSKQPSINYQPNYYSIGGPIQEGKRTYVAHPENKDVKCRMKMKGFRVDKRIFYNRVQLFLDSPIVFETSIWKLNGVISQFILQ